VYADDLEGLPWLVLDVDGLPMQRLNPFWFYKAGIYLGNLAELPEGTTVTSGYRIAEYAKMALRTIMDRSEVPLPKCASLARELIQVLDIAFAPPDHEIPASVLRELAGKVNHLSSMLQADVADLNIYTVGRIGIYDVRALLQRADENLGNTAQESIRQSTRNDLRFAGSCLAFHQFTAAGFHALRAVEAEARRYLRAITGRRVGPETSFGKVASQLNDHYTAAELRWVKRGKKGPRRHDRLGVIGPLMVRINGIYRNPIMHPEMTLDADQAIEVYGLACQVITAMAEDTKARKRKK
jgi:hypothetical protein